VRPGEEPHGVAVVGVARVGVGDVVGEEGEEPLGGFLALVGDGGGQGEAGGGRQGVVKVPEGEGRARALGMGIALLVGKRLLVLAVVLRRCSPLNGGTCGRAKRCRGMGCSGDDNAGEVACRIVCRLAQTGLFEHPGKYADRVEQFFSIARDGSQRGVEVGSRFAVVPTRDQPRCNYTGDGE